MTNTADLHDAITAAFAGSNPRAKRVTHADHQRTWRAER